MSKYTSSYTSKYTKPTTTTSSSTSKYTPSTTRTSSSATKTTVTTRTSANNTRSTGTASKYTPSTTTSKYTSASTTSLRTPASVSNVTAKTTTSTRLTGSSTYYKPMYEMTEKQKEEKTIKEDKLLEDAPAIVVDFGSAMTKVGIGGETIPRYVLPSLAGHPKRPSFIPGLTKKDVYVGEDAQQKREVLAMKWPMQRGRIADFEDVRKILEHVFTELSLLPEEQPLLWTEAPLIPREQREQLAEIIFEKMSMPAVHFVLASVLSVYGCGRPTALVLDLGETMDVVPVYEGGSFSHAIEPAIKRMDVTATDITANMEELLGNRGYYLNTPAERDMVEEIKEKFCYISENPGQEPTVDAEYKLPDGTVLVIGNERFRAPESLFAPALVGKEGHGLHAQVYNAIMESEIDMRVELAGNIILTGGSSLYNGLAPRLKKELEILAPSSKWEIDVIAPVERKYAAWIGGSILGASDNFEKLCVSRELWDELGRSIVHDNSAW